MTTLQNERTQKLIFMGLKELLLKEPFSKITVNQISDQALIHHSTFYTHFDDKYDLLNKYLIHQRKLADFKFEDISDHPYTTIATINNQELLPILKYQSNDRDFSNGFFQFIIDTITLGADKNTELERFFYIGRIKAINLWIEKTNQPYNPFVDYEYLDKIFITGKK